MLKEAEVLNATFASVLISKAGCQESQVAGMKEEGARKMLPWRKRWSGNA